MYGIFVMFVVMMSAFCSAKELRTVRRIVFSFCLVSKSVATATTKHKNDSQFMEFMTNAFCAQFVAFPFYTIMWVISDSKFTFLLMIRQEDETVEVFNIYQTLIFPLTNVKINIFTNVCDVHITFIERIINKIATQLTTSPVSGYYAVLSYHKSANIMYASQPKIKPFPINLWKHLSLCPTSQLSF